MLRRSIRHQLLGSNGIFEEERFEKVNRIPLPAGRIGQKAAAKACRIDRMADDAIRNLKIILF